MNYRKIPVVGETIEEDGWPEVEGLIKEVEDCGFRVIKILNFIGGSTKFIAQLNDGVDIMTGRRALEDIGWRMAAPYHSHGKAVGFKLSKIVAAADVSAWGG